MINIYLKDKLLIKLKIKDINFNYNIFSERDAPFNHSFYNNLKRKKN